MDPKTNWELVMLDSLYIILSSELFSSANENTLGTPWLLLFYGLVVFCLLNHEVTFSGVFTDYRYFPDKVIFLSSPVAFLMNSVCRIPYGLTWEPRQ